MACEETNDESGMDRAELEVETEYGWSITMTARVSGAVETPPSRGEVMRAVFVALTTDAMLDQVLEGYDLCEINIEEAAP